MERFQTLGTYTRDLTPAQTGEFMRNEEKLWWPIVRQVKQGRNNGDCRRGGTPRNDGHLQPPGVNAPGGISLGST